jgi:hypothetical protein
LAGSFGLPYLLPTMMSPLQRTALTMFIVVLTGCSKDSTGSGRGGGGTATGANDQAVCTDLQALSPKVDVPPCDALDQAACLCEGCIDDGVCFASEDMMVDDCVCPDCRDDAYCNLPDNCMVDNQCNPYSEGCDCPDCANHELCGGPGFGGSGVGGGAP